MSDEVKVIEYAYGMLRYADGHGPVKGHLHMVLWQDYKRVVDELAAKDADREKAVTSANDLHNETIAELKRQLAVSDRLRERTEAQLAEANKALEPFDRALDLLKDEWAHTGNIRGTGPDAAITPEHLRAARRALTQKEPK